jgi:hypothetical protein
MEIPRMVVEVNTAGLEAIAAIIARLHHRNQELERALTAVQAESTRQVEALRTLTCALQAAGVSPSGAGCE